MRAIQKLNYLLHFRPHSLGLLMLVTTELAAQNTAQTQVQSQNSQQASQNALATQAEQGKPSTVDSGYSWEGAERAPMSATAQPAADAQSANSESPDAKLDPAENEFAEQMRVASSQSVRRFHEVLDELLAEFGYDVKMGQINGLKNLSIRQVDVSEAIPKTYRRYLELLVQERLRENSKIRLISCLPCRSKTSRLVEGKLLVTSPMTNMEELNRAGDQLGIDNFMDVVLVYHTTHMVLAFQIFNAKSKETVWSRTYNSETIRSRYQKLAVDYTQVDKARTSEQYVPEYRILVGLGGASVPNIGGTVDDSGMLNITFRGTEKFNNRRQEFGLNLSFFQSSKVFMSEVPTEGTAAAAETVAEEETEEIIAPKPFTTAIGLFAVYVHNFLGPIETYNKIRYGFHVGAGPLIAAGYLAPALQFGLDAYFGRRFVVSPNLMLVGQTKILVGDEFVATQGGIGGDIVLSLNY
jgi:hypothetical protein